VEYHSLINPTRPSHMPRGPSTHLSTYVLREGMSVPALYASCNPPLVSTCSMLVWHRRPRLV